MRRTSLHTWADDNDLSLTFAWYNNGLLKVSPLRIVKYRNKFSCTPILASVFWTYFISSIFLYSLAFKFGLNIPLVIFYNSQFVYQLFFFISIFFNKIPLRVFPFHPSVIRFPNNYPPGT